MLRGTLDLRENDGAWPRLIRLTFRHLASQTPQWPQVGLSKKASSSMSFVAVSSEPCVKVWTPMQETLSSSRQHFMLNSSPETRELNLYSSQHFLTGSHIRINWTSFRHFLCFHLSSQTCLPPTQRVYPFDRRRLPKKWEMSPWGTFPTDHHTSFASYLQTKSWRSGCKKLDFFLCDLLVMHFVWVETFPPALGAKKSSWKLGHALLLESIFRDPQLAKELGSFLSKRFHGFCTDSAIALPCAAQLDQQWSSVFWKRRKGRLPFSPDCNVLNISRSNTINPHRDVISKEDLTALWFK